MVPSVIFTCDSARPCPSPRTYNSHLCCMQEGHLDIFWAPCQNILTPVVCRKVSVAHITPGSQPPADTDYWWDMEHDRRFSTFKDVYPAGTQRPSQHAADQPRVSQAWSSCPSLLIQAWQKCTSSTQHPTDKAKCCTQCYTPFCVWVAKSCACYSPIQAGKDNC